ncbi:hypothetical protein QQF64_016727 [Cirrhinus molitorella]|uniref:Uncharacterized protein n=1 Tax=Cirrhinus molitorella TaxID=172907 RepID=A0ABR3LNM6_9TELE
MLRHSPPMTLLQHQIEPVTPPTIRSPPITLQQYQTEPVAPPAVGSTDTHTHTHAHLPLLLEHCSCAAVVVLHCLYYFAGPSRVARSNGRRQHPRAGAKHGS